MHLFTVLDARSLRSSCQQGWFLLRLLSWPYRWSLLPVFSRDLSSVWVCVLIITSYRVCVLSRSVVSDLCDPWTVACPAPLSMGFLSPEYWNGLPFPPPGDLSNPAIKSTSLMSPALAGGVSTTGPPGKPTMIPNSSWIPGRGSHLASRTVSLISQFRVFILPFSGFQMMFEWLTIVAFPLCTQVSVEHLCTGCPTSFSGSESILGLSSSDLVLN